MRRGCCCEMDKEMDKFSGFFRGEIAFKMGWGAKL
jgi:hypothetical protein